MSILDQLASELGHWDEAPNQELARRLASAKDTESIQEIADNLESKDVRIQNDCLKVLYEIGHINPGLVAPYTKDFLKLLGSKHNRQVWVQGESKTCQVPSSCFRTRYGRDTWQICIQLSCRG